MLICGFIDFIYSHRRSCIPRAVPHREINLLMTTADWPFVFTVDYTCPPPLLFPYISAAHDIHVQRLSYMLLRRCLLLDQYTNILNRLKQHPPLPATTSNKTLTFLTSLPSASDTTASTHPCHHPRDNSNIFRNRAEVMARPGLQSSCTEASASNMDLHAPRAAH